MISEVRRASANKISPDVSANTAGAMSFFARLDAMLYD
jgi:hypothetical protein